jgi:hypothetical protein
MSWASVLAEGGGMIAISPFAGLNISLNGEIFGTSSVPFLHSQNHEAPPITKDPKW